MNKARTRWGIALAFAALVLIGVRLFWPRWDPRFVGTWQRVRPNLSVEVIMFRRNGTGSYGTGDAGRSSFHWIVRGSQLKLTYGYQPGLEGVVDRLNHLVGRPSLMYDGQLYDILEVSADRMVWRMASPGQRITAETDEAFEVRRLW
jgi:hypothetical protein